MNYTTVEAEIDHGHVTVKEPDKLPVHGRGLLIVLSAEVENIRSGLHPARVQLPLIRGDGLTTINPTPEQLDASLWD
jgi:hypothetical protein